MDSQGDQSLARGGPSDLTNRPADSGAPGAEKVIGSQSPGPVHAYGHRGGARLTVVAPGAGQNGSCETALGEEKPRPDVVRPDGVPSRASVMQQPRAITLRSPGEYFVSGVARMKAVILNNGLANSR